MRWAAIDFETANETRGSACAIGVTLVDDATITSTRSWLIRPRELRFDPFNVDIHGITPEAVADKPEWPDIWSEVSELVNGRTIVAHNAGFDMSVLRHTFDEYGLRYPEFEYFCTWVVSRRAWPGMFSYRLDDLADHFGLSLRHHEAASDAEACANLALLAHREHGAQSVEELAETLKFRIGRMQADGWTGCCVKDDGTWSIRSSKGVTPRTSEFDPDHPFYGRNVVFTGKLERFTRREGIQLVVDHGGACPPGVTKKVDYLVVGEQDIRKLRGGTKSSKMRKAEDLLATGVPIELLGEDDFLRMLDT